MAQRVIVTLSDDAAERVRARVASGEYANESAVIEDAVLNTLSDDVDDLADWMKDEIREALAEADRDPSTLRTSAQVRATLGLPARLHERKQDFDAGA